MDHSQVVKAVLIALNLIALSLRALNHACLNLREHSFRDQSFRCRNAPLGRGRWGLAAGVRRRSRVGVAVCRNGKGSQQLRLSRQAHGVIQHTSIEVVAQFSGLQ